VKEGESTLYCLRHCYGKAACLMHCKLDRVVSARGSHCMNEQEKVSFYLLYAQRSMCRMLEEIHCRSNDNGGKHFLHHREKLWWIMLFHEQRTSAEF
jgi:hypothetical protein